MKHFLIIIISVFFVGLANYSYAQSQILQDPGTRFLDEQDRERTLNNLKKARPGQKLKVKAPVKVEREEICFPVNAIRLRGVSVIDPNALSELLDNYKDTCMGQKAIGALIELINKVYVEAGFITTRAYVPQQDLNDGVLLVDVIEGRIEGFVYRIVDKDGNVEAGKPRKINLAFPIKPGEVFQLRDIEQGLDQINRLASSQAKVDLLPGNQPGTSLVVITEQKVDLYRATITYDNRGSESTGVDRTRVSLEADDTLSLNEAYSLSYLGTQNTNVVAYDYSIPYGYWTLSSSGSYSESLTEASALSDLFNQTVNVSASLEKLISRDAEQKTWAYARANYYWNSRFINLAELTPQTRTALSAGIRTERYSNNGVFAFDLGLTRGVPFFGADENFAVLGPDIPHAEFDKLDFSASYLHQFENGNSLSSSVFGQWANVPLFAEQQLTIGGWGSVRGFQGDEASGERGFIMRNELNLPFPALEKLKLVEGQETPPKLTAGEKFYSEHLRGLQPYLFADIGLVQNLVFEDTTHMIGAGFGIRGRMGRVTLDAAAAFPLTENNSTSFGDVQGLINVSFKLF